MFTQSWTVTFIYTCQRHGVFCSLISRLTYCRQDKELYIYGTSKNLYVTSKKWMLLKGTPSETKAITKHYFLSHLSLYLSVPSNLTAWLESHFPTNSEIELGCSEDTHHLDSHSLDDKQSYINAIIMKQGFMISVLKIYLFHCAAGMDIFQSIVK